MLLLEANFSIRGVAELDVVELDVNASVFREAVVHLSLLPDFVQVEMAVLDRRLCLEDVEKLLHVCQTLPSLPKKSTLLNPSLLLRAMEYR